MSLASELGDLPRPRPFSTRVMSRIALTRRGLLTTVFTPILSLFQFAALGHGAPSPDDVNKIAGCPLFADTSLWDDSSSDAARRLGWPAESSTSAGDSYRLYSEDVEEIDTTFFGGKARSRVLYGEGGLVSGISVVYANRGDSLPSLYGQARKPIHKQQARDYKRDIKSDKGAVESSLNSLFGRPELGRGTLMRGNGVEEYQKWVWNGHIFLLTSPRNEYVSLRIVPEILANNEKVSDQILKGRLASGILRRGNGDVVLTEIPMVDQGPKGYCVPATWERVLRYMGIPSDMYVLAMDAQTGDGGGTVIENILKSTEKRVVAAGRRFSSPRIPPRVASISRYIDRGLPLIWTMTLDYELFSNAVRRTAVRTTLPEALPKKPGAGAARARPPKNSGKGGEPHVCLIVGYNASTGEICVSNSWRGGEFTWITEPEADQLSLGSFVVVEP